MKIDVYSDIVCPWCYIGERRLARALAAFPGGEKVEVVFRPFQLDPGAPVEAVPTMAHLEHRFGNRVGGMLSQVSAAGRSEGITFAWDKALSVNTRRAHRVLQLARLEYGPPVQRALAERLFAMHFSEGADVSDATVLLEAAIAAGMARDRVAAYLDSDEGAQELTHEFESARARGIQAVPTFVVDDRFVMRGAQPAAELLAELEAAARDAAPASDEAAGVCGPEGCEVPDGVTFDSAMAKV